MITFRPTKQSDYKLLSRWRNDPVSLKNKGRNKPFTEEENFTHFDRVRDSHWIARHNGTVIGGILLQNRGHGYLGIPWSIGTEMRGLGMGKEMVCAAVKAFPGAKKARIKKDNIASLKCAEAAGYIKVDEDDEYITLVWEAA